MHVLKLLLNRPKVEISIHLVFCRYFLINDWSHHFIHKLVKCKEIIALSDQKSYWQLVFFFVKKFLKSLLVLDDNLSVYFEKLQNEIFNLFANHNLKRFCKELNQVLWSIGLNSKVGRLNDRVFKIYVLLKNVDDERDKLRMNFP